MKHLCIVTGEGRWQQILKMVPQYHSSSLQRNRPLIFIVVHDYLK